MRGRMCDSPKHTPAQAGAGLGDGPVYRADAFFGEIFTQDWWSAVIIR